MYTLESGSAEISREEFDHRAVEPLLEGLPVESRGVDAGHLPDARVGLCECGVAGRAEREMARRLHDMRLRRGL